MLGLLNTVLSRGGSLLTYVKDGLVMANRFLTPPKLTFPVDASAEFNGTSDYITTPNLSIQSSATWTIGAWVYSDWTSSGADYLFDGREGAADGFSLYTTNGNSWTYYDNNGGATTGSNFVKNDWYYLTIVRNGSSSVKVYKDGSLTDTLTGRATSYDVTGPFYIGSRFTTLENFQGNIANFAAWNRALSSDEINSVMWKTYEQVSTTEKSELQAWYKLSADEVLSGDSTATLTTYANANSLTFEAPACVQTALNGLPDITDARLYSANYDIRVKADGGTVESLSCVETELNAIL
jgi:hypothetical protein